MKLPTIQTTTICYLLAAAQTALLAADWPQFQRDAARTGFSPDSPAPPYEMAYTLDFAPEWLGLVQPIISSDVMYVPTKQGRLYAFDPTDGRKLWMKDGLGTIIRTPAAAGDKVFVANLEGKVLAVSTDGKTVAWERDLGFSISAALCIDEDRLYVGTRRGDFFCLDATNGKTIWKTTLDHYVWSAAAVSDGKVFVGTDGELHLYCLDAANGDRLWKSDKLYGVLIRDWCPVVTAGKVFIYTFPAENAIAAYSEPKPYSTWEKPDWDKHFPELRKGALPDDFKRANTLVKRMFRKFPWKQTFYVFDVETGKAPYIPVAFRRLSPWFAPDAPPAVDSEGLLQMTVPYGSGRFGRLDPATGDIAHIMVGYKGTNPDEAHASSCGGDRVYWKHFAWGGCDTSIAYNLKTHDVTELNRVKRARTHRTLKISEGTHEMRRTDLKPADDNNEGDNTALTIWKDLLFHQSGDRVYAVKGLGGE